MALILTAFMEVKKLQEKIEKFWEKVDKLKGRKYTPEIAFCHIVEEVGELAKEFVNKERRPEKYSKEKLIDAIGDIIVCTFLLASLYKLNVEKLLKKILKEGENRIEKLKKLKRKNKI